MALATLHPFSSLYPRINGPAALNISLLTLAAGAGGLEGGHPGEGGDDNDDLAAAGDDREPGDDGPDIGEDAGDADDVYRGGMDVGGSGMLDPGQAATQQQQQPSSMGE